jgi:cyclase
MLKTRVIPVLLLANGGLVKTVNFKNPKYVGDPMNTVKIFNEKEVDELAFLDIEASKNNQSPNFDFIKTIASEAFMPFSYGGGIKTLQDVEKILTQGAEKVIINTALYKDSNFLKEVVNNFGAQSVVACIDVKKNFIGQYSTYSHAGSVEEGMSLDEILQRIEDLACGEIIIQSIDKDGTMEGYDLKLISYIDKKISVPLVALGGCGELNDFKRVIEAGADAAAAGSFFVFYGKYKAVLITYPPHNEIEKVLK